MYNEREGFFFFSLVIKTGWINKLGYRNADETRTRRIAHEVMGITYVHMPSDEVKGIYMGLWVALVVLHLVSCC